MKILLVALVAMPAIAMAQGTTWNEAWVGSEWEVYARALADRGLLRGEPWSVRPFAPRVIGTWATTVSDSQPWTSRLARQPERHALFSALRPSITTSYNSAFAWGMNDGPVWQGRGANGWATFGAALRYGIFSARLEPLVDLAQNRAFALTPVPGGASRFVDDLRPRSIDLPQRFGDGAVRIVDPGQSYVRADYRNLAIGLSTEDVFWGPGVRHALLFDANAAGFPHLFIGTSHALATPIGRFHAQFIYGRLEESDWAPASGSTSRFGTGGILVWMPPSQPIEVGFARFYHRRWPDHFTSHDILSPFGSFFRDRQSAGSGPADNQLLSFFATIRVPASGIEIFGEFGKNDRNGDLRDALVEPEHDAAWMLGLFKVFGAPSLTNGFWTFRTEIGNGRITPLQQIGRNQTTFYDHSPVTQGHTESGQLLGSPLIDRSGGLEAAVDRWWRGGRIGVSVLERQMPPDLNVGLPALQARSQWDIGATGTLFLGGNDLSVAFGAVRDFDRFPGTDVSNLYARVGFRAALP